ncbi:MAG: hypothetical protein AAFN93_27535 [Bacteroidota bacterium]
MKIILKTIIIIVSTTLSTALWSQEIGYNSYNNINNPDFESFVQLFDPIPLPLSTESIWLDDVLNQVISKSYIEQEDVDNFLKIGGEYIAPPAFTNINESGEELDVYGDFIPLFSLPTNGDYVLLVVMRDAVSGDSNKNVWVYSYDLEGNFIYIVGHLIMDGIAYIAGQIDNQLRSSYTYLSDFQGEYSECNPCNEEYKIHTFQINSEGRLDELNFESFNSEMYYSNTQQRFVLNSN